MTSRSALHLVDLGSTCLMAQLRLEEALHRLAPSNYLVVNRATPAESTIVLGLSGVVADLVHERRAHRDRIRLIRRYSGGGTVYIDRHAIMISFVMGAGVINPGPSPRAIMRWSKDLYQDVFRRCSSSEFHLVENDYCFGDRKFAGNAQAISGQRWVHHTSLLWDVNREAMASYLRPPKLQPAYRARRDHDAFLCGLREHIDGGQERFERAFLLAVKEWFDVVEMPCESLIHLVSQQHRRATSEIVLQPGDCLSEHASDDDGAPSSI